LHGRLLAERAANAEAIRQKNHNLDI